MNTTASERQIELEELKRKIAELEARGPDEKAGKDAAEKAEGIVVQDVDHRCGPDGVLLLCSVSGSGDRQRFRATQCPENISRILLYDKLVRGLWAYDEMSHRRIITRRPPWEKSSSAMYPRPERDDDYAALACLINRRYGLAVHRDLRDGVAMAARQVVVNPLRDYLESLRGSWDGTPRVATMLHDLLGVADDTDDTGRSYVATATLLWLRGAIHRAIDDGPTKMDLMLILAGPQGCGKSTFFSRLAHRPEWLVENLDDIGNEARCFEQTSGRWLVCLDELAAMRRQKDMNRLKTYISREWDDYRKPYARIMESFPRHYAFCGTTNEAEIFVDPTGARRFLVATCGVVEPSLSLWDDSIDAYIDQVWAEALELDRRIVEAEGRVELRLPAWAVEAQRRDNEERQQDDGTRGVYEDFIEWAWEHGETISASRVLMESLDWSLDDLARAPYKNKMLQEVSCILAASPNWESVGRASVRGVRWHTGEQVNFGRQRAYRPVGREVLVAAAADSAEAARAAAAATPAPLFERLPDDDELF